MTEEEILATNLRQYPERRTTPVMPAVDPNRLNVKDLEAMLATLRGEPIDYSGVEEVARARESAGGRGMLGGMALSMLGGESLRPHGQRAFSEGLDLRQPLRANAADVGYYNPETGGFVENPQARRSREEKLITGRLDARVREEEAKARLAAAQATGNAADIRNANKELTDLVRLTIAQRAADTAARVGEAKAGKMDRDTGKPPKAIPKGQLDQLETNVAGEKNLARLHATFQDSYSGYGPLSQALVYGETLLGGLASKESEARQNWWADFKMFQELKTRHDLFGATLTAGEQAAWNAAQKINPRSSPRVVRDAIKGLREAVQDRHRRLYRQMRNEGKDPSAYEMPGVTDVEGAGASGDFGGGGWTEVAPGVRVREKR